MSHQLNFIFQKGDWTTPKSFPDLSNEKSIAIDLETRDPNLKTLGSGWTRKDGEIVGIAVATPNFNGYFPIGHDVGGNMDRNMVLNWFKDVCKTPGNKIFHNASYDLGWIRSYGYQVNGTLIDTMIAAAIVDENKFSYSLNNLARDYLGKMKAETELRERADEWGLDAKADLWKLPAQYVGFYAEQDAQLTLELWQRLDWEIRSQSLDDIWKLEMNLLPEVIKMREHGVRVDLEGADKLKKKFILREKELLKKVKDMTSLDVDVWAARSVAAAFDRLGIKYPLTEKTAEPSFTANWLENCKEPLAKLIKEIREVNKFYSAFIDSIIRHAHKGRIHAEINQLRGTGGGTVTGRLSYSSPNLQQIPARNKELGPLIRSLFLPDEGCRWGSFDYSQQEPRLVVHFASLIGEGYEGTQELIKAYEQEDADFHQTVAEMANIPRAQAKTINLGLFYGMGINKLSRELGISYEDAQSILQEYNKRVPFVKKLSEKCIEVADKVGFVRTLKGRRCRFNLWEPITFGLHKAMTEQDAILQFGRKGIRRAMTYKSLNRLIQGSAADQTKQAMVDCSANGNRPLLQIHDELCFNIHKDEDIKKIKDSMENCCKLTVPSKVDVEIGDNWGNAK
jgi:DNA polymerase I-like protein with 3'-5' exonuclease and polymerase domains